jgi:DNA replication licensing factor MCM4
VRPFNLRKVYKIREMDPSHVEKLITIKGIVIRCSEVVPEMKEANFKCGKCFTAEYKFLERGRIIEPDFCSNCRNRGTF